MGLHHAGFEVVGVDLRPQPRYPFCFIQADALRPPFDLRTFDLVWASPPCQVYTQMSARWRGRSARTDGHPDLIGPTRDLLRAAGVPYAIENVIGARRHMLHPITLCGAQFGLGVHRPRLFETSFFMLVPQTARSPVGAVGVYGKRPDGRRLWTRSDGDLRAAKSLEEGARAMGVGWMLWSELKEAVPPAYSEFIGRDFLERARPAGE
jgi:DNA (cytosine-5)-methyltransferase 1